MSVAALLNTNIQAAPGAVHGAVRIRVMPHARPLGDEVQRLADAAPPGEPTLFVTRGNRTLLALIVEMHRRGGDPSVVHWAAPGVAAQLRDLCSRCHDRSLEETRRFAEGGATTADDPPPPPMSGTVAFEVLLAAIELEGCTEVVGSGQGGGREVRPRVASPFLAFVKALLEANRDVAPRLVLATIHGAKVRCLRSRGLHAGSEFPHVLLHEYNRLGSDRGAWHPAAPPPTTATCRRTATCCTSPSRARCAR